MKFDEYFKPFPVLRTPRLTLRSLTHRDVNDVFDYCSRREVAEYVAWSPHRAANDSRGFIDWVLMNYKNALSVTWGVELSGASEPPRGETAGHQGYDDALRGEGGIWKAPLGAQSHTPSVHSKIIGTCSYVQIDPHFKVAELGYALSSDYWGMGLASEAALALVNFGFSHVGFQRIEARCMVENAASVRVLEKVGMRLEGVLRKGIYCKGAARDLRLYAVTDEDYFKKLRME